MKHPNKRTIALKMVFVFSNVKNFDIIAKTVSFVLALEQILETCLSNFNSLLLIETPKSFNQHFPIFYLLQLGSILVHLHNLKLSDDTYLCSVSYSCFQTSRKLIQYFPLTTLILSLYFLYTCQYF